jgi:hypothetical protein
MKLVQLRNVTQITVYYTNGGADQFRLFDGDEEKIGGDWLYITYADGRNSVDIHLPNVAQIKRFKGKEPIPENAPQSVVPVNTDPSGGDLL